MATGAASAWAHFPGIDDDQALPSPLARFPAPIGGVPSAVDYAPSCVFVVLYALLVPVAVYRLCARGSRNLIVVFSFAFLVERLVFFVIRASEAHASDAQRASLTYLAYTQSTLAAGFLSVGKDLVAAVRGLLVRSADSSHGTMPLSRLDSNTNPKLEARWAQAHTVVPSASFADEPVPPPRVTMVPCPSTAPLPSSSSRSSSPSFTKHWSTIEGSVFSLSRRPHLNATGRRWRMTPAHERQAYDIASVLLAVAFVVVIALALSSGGTYANAVFDEGWAASTVRLRYISCGLGLALISLVHMGAYWAWARSPEMGHSSVVLVSAICTLLSVAGVYRLIVIGIQTTNLLSTGPGSLNSNSSKATFYVFHIAPEWLAVALFLSVNVRKRFGRGSTLCESEAVADNV